MNIRDVAASYIAAGWQVVPLAPGEKACKDPGWTKLIFKPEDFQPNDNIGIRSVEGVTDVDYDAEEIADLAKAFLPPTGTVYGRPAKPRAHWLYRTTIKEPHKYLDLVTADKKKATLIEIRVNHQSMAPPSIHPGDGQRLEWEQPLGSPAQIIDAELVRACQLVATCALIIRYYNPPGNRHEWGVALSGTLRQLTLTEAEAHKVITTAGERVGDTKVEDRIRALQDTYAKPDDDPLKSAKALGELMLNGQQFVSSLRKIWGEDVVGVSKGKLEELNSKHAVIFQQSGDLVVITEDRDVDNRPFIRFSSPETIRMLYPQMVRVGSTAKGSAVLKPLGQAWLTHPKRRFYNGIELAPNGRATPGYYNMWRGFAVEPAPGSWSRFKEHVYEVICDRQDYIFKYVIAWMANAVQKPGYQANTAIALRGGQGTGKGAFVRGFGALFGIHFVHLDSTRHLTGNFNAHLHNAILVFADEAAWPGDKAGLGALKRLVTEPTLSIERKGMDIMTVPNMIHLLLASNEEWVVPAAIDERRFTVLDVNKKQQNNTSYFAALEKELHEEGGLAAMLHDLLDYNIEVNLRKIPQTQALIDQKRMTGGPQRRWWYQVLLDGDFWTSEVPRRPGCYYVEKRAVYENYVQTLDRAGQRLKSIQTELGTFLKKVLPEPFPEIVRRRDERGGWKDREWIFPSLKECREHYDKLHEIVGSSEWPPEEEQPTELLDSHNM